MEQDPLKQEQLSSTNPADKGKLKEGEGAMMTHDQWRKSIIEAESESLRSTEPQNRMSRIRRVPQVLHSVNHFEKYFEPRVVSIGPYHHRNTLLWPMQDLKRKVARSFFYGSGEKFDAACKSLENEIGVLRACYDDNSIHEYDNEQFTRMMLEDGCFVLDFIDCDNKTHHMDLKGHHRAFVQQDLFLLENQIPFRVLQILVKYKPESQSQTKATSPSQTPQQESQDDKLPFQTPQQESQDDRLMKMIKDFIESCSKIMTSQLDDKCMDEGPHAHLLELLWKWLVNRKTAAPGVGPTQDGRINACCRRRQQREAYSFRNVSELTAAGIKIKPNKTRSLTEISFSTSYWLIFGDLKLPQITIDDSTGSKFMNLVAYEMCPDVTTNLEVTSFLCFLDSLIDHPDDVKQLRAARVIQNMLGSDEEVAILFNEIGTDLVPDPMAYERVKEDIQDHYESKWKYWLALWIHEHFHTPWSGMALGVAVYAIILSSYDVFQRSDCDSLCKTIRKNTKH